MSNNFCNSCDSCNFSNFCDFCDCCYMCIGLKGTKEKPIKFHIFNKDFKTKEKYYAELKRLRSGK